MSKKSKQVGVCRTQDVQFSHQAMNVPRMPVKIPGTVVLPRPWGAARRLWLFAVQLVTLNPCFGMSSVVDVKSA